LRRRGLRYGYGFLRGEPGYRYLLLRVLLREELRSSLQVRLPFGRPRGLRSSGGFRVRSFRGLLELSELLQGVSFLTTGFKVSLLELVKLLRRSLRASASASARLPPAHSFVHCEGEDKSDGFPVTSQPIRLLRYPGLRLRATGLRCFRGLLFFLLLALLRSFIGFVLVSLFVLVAGLTPAHLLVHVHPAPVRVRAGS